jgi:hypothetical protein
MTDKLAATLLRSEIAQAERHGREITSKNLIFVEREFQGMQKMLEGLAGDIYLFAQGEISLKQLQANASKVLPAK